MQNQVHGFKFSLSGVEDTGVEKTVIKLLTGNRGRGIFYGENPELAQSIVKELIEKYKLVPSRYPQIEEYVEGEGYGCSW